MKWSSSREKESSKFSSNTQNEDNKESELLVESLLPLASPPDINWISRHTKRKIATITLCSDKVNAQNKLKQVTQKFEKQADDLKQKSVRFMYVTTNLYEEKLRVKESEIEEQKIKNQRFWKKNVAST